MIPYCASTNERRFDLGLERGRLSKERGIEKRKGEVRGMESYGTKTMWMNNECAIRYVEYMCRECHPCPRTLFFL